MKNNLYFKLFHFWKKWSKILLRNAEQNPFEKVFRKFFYVNKSGIFGFCFTFSKGGIRGFHSTP